MRNLVRGLLALVVTVNVSACHPRAPSVAKIEQPGFFVLQTTGQTTLVRSGRRGIRSCLAHTVTPVTHRVGGHKHGLAGSGQNNLDYAFFRLCEALANGDLSQAQYLERVDRLLDALARPPSPRPPWSSGYTFGRPAHSGPRPGLAPNPDAAPPLEQPALLPPWPPVPSGPPAAPPSASGSAEPPPAPSAPPGGPPPL